MRQITLEELLEAGCHFGHQVNRRNPKSNRYIFEARQGVHIINLEDTHKKLLEAAEFLKNLAASGGTIIVVGTKRQAKVIVEEEVTRAREINPDNIHYVKSRWIGGILTNFGEVSKNFKRLHELEKIINSPDRGGYTKREVVLFEKELQKLNEFYQGIADMKGIPSAVFIIDTHAEDTAVREASRTGVTTVGITDTNSDPTAINHPIPANDDAVGSIKLITSYLIDAWIEGSKDKTKSDNAAAAKAAEEAKKAVEAAAKAEKEAAKTAA